MTTGDWILAGGIGALALGIGLVLALLFAMSPVVGAAGLAICLMGGGITAISYGDMKRQQDRRGF